MLALPRAIQAQPAGAQAEVLFRQGKDLMAAGKIAEACAAFDASQKVDPTVTTLLNPADCREKNRRLATAWGLFLQVLRGGDVLDPATWNKALPIDGGTHPISARAPGDAEWSSSVTVAAERDAKTIEIPKLRPAEFGRSDPEPEPKPKATSPSAVRVSPRGPPPARAAGALWSPKRKLWLTGAPEPRHGIAIALDVSTDQVLVIASGRF